MAFHWPSSHSASLHSSLRRHSNLRPAKAASLLLIIQEAPIRVDHVRIITRWSTSTESSSFPKTVSVLAAIERLVGPFKCLRFTTQQPSGTIITSLFTQSGCGRTMKSTAFVQRHWLCSNGTRRRPLRYGPFWTVHRGRRHASMLNASAARNR